MRAELDRYAAMRFEPCILAYRANTRGNSEDILRIRFGKANESCGVIMSRFTNKKDARTPSTTWKSSRSAYETAASKNPLLSWESSYSKYLKNLGRRASLRSRQLVMDERREEIPEPFRLDNRSVLLLLVVRADEQWMVCVVYLDE